MYFLSIHFDVIFGGPDLQNYLILRALSAKTVPIIKFKYFSLIRMLKSRRMRWAGHVARMGEKRNAYRILVGKPEGKRPLGRPRRRWVDNIKMDLGETGWDSMDWIDLAQDRDQWRALVNTVMNLRVPSVFLVHRRMIGGVTI
jgi:hypothetical protein